ncbi:MAG: hypothetical protein KIS76_12765 [Pyrinomonadaceae bacterium]|nr:hypothetical protein [Pyrinomonadaceae bacterium]
MRRKPKLDPIMQRRGQIERELEKLKLPKNQKTRKDFKSDEGFENWETKQGVKFFELNEEMIMLDNPSEYAEIPIAIAAAELGTSLNELLEVFSEKLVEMNSSGVYKAGSRISREELTRLMEIGADELVRIARQPIEEIFDEAVASIHAGDLEAAQNSYERIERFPYQCNYAYWIACEIGIDLLTGEFASLADPFWFINSYRQIELAGILEKVSRVVEGIKPKDHLSAVVCEQILAVAEGGNHDPFRDSYRRWTSTEYFSKMDENQRHAMLLSSVVLHAVKKYNFSKTLDKWRGFASTAKDEEMERVIRNAIYTALEAESTYYDSPSSKLFVEKFVGLFPKRWIPAERIELLPKNEK